jgi:hypothetical protein
VSVEFLVKLRDAAQMVANAANEQLEKMAPPEVKASEEDYDKLFWEKTTGAKGEYEKTSKKATQNHPIFQALQERLKKHNGKGRFAPYFYWTFDKDPDTIGRKKLKSN